MIERAVIKSKKNQDGDILGLCNPNEYWSPKSKNNAIYEIESGSIKYYVPWIDGTRTNINVVNGPNGKYLRTDKDSTYQNNLNDLPDC